MGFARRGWFSHYGMVSAAGVLGGGELGFVYLIHALTLHGERVFKYGNRDVKPSTEMWRAFRVFSVDVWWLRVVLKVVGAGAC
eukprot:5388673-Pyramimonas_sp.AAC.1